MQSFICNLLINCSKRWIVKKFENDEKIKLIIWYCYSKLKQKYHKKCGWIIKFSNLNNFE